MASPQNQRNIRIVIDGLKCFLVSGEFQKLHRVVLTHCLGPLKKQGNIIEVTAGLSNLRIPVLPPACFQLIHQRSDSRTTGGPRDQLKRSTYPNINQYFKWSAHQKSLGTPALARYLDIFVVNKNNNNFFCRRMRLLTSNALQTSSIATTQARYRKLSLQQPLVNIM